MDKDLVAKAKGNLQRRRDAQLAQVAAGRYDSIAGFRDVIEMINYLDGVEKSQAPSKPEK